MITFPNNWTELGLEPTKEIVDELFTSILYKLGCKNLSLSGGIDSSLMLWYMAQCFEADSIKCFNVALSNKHPDYIYSEMVSHLLGVKCFHFIPYNVKLDSHGNEIVKIFYRDLFLSYQVSEIIACDGIDELLGGYYAHAENPCDAVFFDFLSRLQKEQLEPLNKNSGNVSVLLPYLDIRFIALVSFIPTWNKYGLGYRKKFLYSLAKGRIPTEIIERRKYGFCDAMRIKGDIK